MKLTTLATVLLLTFLVEDVASSKILAIMLVPSGSHILWYAKYLEGLLGRGHSVTYVGLDRIKNDHPNLRQVTFEKLRAELFDDDFVLSSTTAGPMKTALLLDEWDNAISSYIKKTDEFKRFLRIIKTESFDLVVQDIAECVFMLGAASVLKDASVVGFTPYGRPTWTMELLKTPVLYSSHPNILLPYVDEMPFIERVNNFLFHVFNWGSRSLYMNKQNKHARDAFGDDIEPLEKILERMHIIMVNTNEAVDYPHPGVPGLIHIGGFHIDPPKDLPKEMKTYLDNATAGAIYVSFGTNIVSSHFAAETVGAMAEAFRELAPIKVLWKWNGDEFPGKPHNVKLVDWVPQNDVLAHPNLRLFFTHSGLLSTQEAMYHGVPILGAPVFLDQHSNLKLCIHKGMGEGIPFTELTKEAILEKSRKILTDKKYAENAKRVSVLYRDVMEGPRERAMFWTEYAIRHKGAPHLSLHARKMAWYQRAQLDIYLFLFVAFPCALYVAVRLLLNLGRTLRGQNIKIKTN